MTLKFEPPDDRRLARALVPLYEAPSDDRYWQSLEGRIMARVSGAAEAPLEWWSVIAGWSRPALVAAGLAAVVAGLAALHTRDVQAGRAWEAAVATSTPALLPVAAMRTSDSPASERDETLRYLISQ